MSWDIYIDGFPDSIKRVADIPDDVKLRPLGKRSDLIAQIREVAPQADFSNPEWGILEGDGFSIEFMMGAEEVLRGGFTLFVRGGGNPAPLIASILNGLDLRGIDCQTSEFFDLEAAQASFGAWQRYRDQVLGQHPGPDEGGEDES
jgi:hypothetical protein